MSHDAPPTEHEAEIRAQYERLPERMLAEISSSTLAVLLDRVARHQSERPAADRLRLTAALAGGIRAFRSTRAGMAMLGCGYEIEAEAMSRVLLELFVETRAAVHDPSGETARSWLAGGRKRGIGARVRAAMPHSPDTYGQISRAAHGDPGALTALAVGETNIIEWGPRQTSATTRCLTGFAVATRDMAVLLEEASDQQFAELESLDLVLSSSVPGWRPDKHWEPDAGA